ncbi:hypothetical protein GU700_19105 [Methylobacterium sp. NI91]|nr:hypothetical protein [Methylobacterium sp. NI91]QIJ76499.1 hypothetical protein CLZ_19100 [Methylobacterium sp. CLZ]QIJ81402.1 hypothetical protein GU700_19105 [Methylobacterium sp. NI91]
MSGHAIKLNQFLGRKLVTEKYVGIPGEYPAPGSIYLAAGDPREELSLSEVGSAGSPFKF